MASKWSHSCDARIRMTVTGLLCLSGCLTANDYYRPRLQSSLPVERGQAIVALAESGQADVVPALVDMLEDPDAGVRLLAIQGLVRVSGNDYGYRYYHPEARRAAAVERWREAIRRNEIVVRSGTRSLNKRDADPSSTSAGADEAKSNTP